MERFFTALFPSSQRNLQSGTSSHLAQRWSPAQPFVSPDPADTETFALGLEHISIFDLTPNDPGDLCGVPLYDLKGAGSRDLDDPQEEVDAVLRVKTSDCSIVESGICSRR